MADDVLGELRCGDQLLDIDARGDVHLLAQEDEGLGADIAGRALVSREGAAAEPGDGREQSGPCRGWQGALPRKIQRRRRLRRSFEPRGSALAAPRSLTGRHLSVALQHVEDSRAERGA